VINEFDAIGKRLIYREVSFKRVHTPSPKRFGAASPNRLAHVSMRFPAATGSLPWAQSNGAGGNRAT